MTSCLPVTVEFSTRMRVSLGLCRPVQGRVRVVENDPRLPAAFNKPRPRWEHRCPVCHVRRVAGRPVRQWRCVECLKAGLSGKLVITKLPPPDGAFDMSEGRGALLTAHPWS